MKSTASKYKKKIVLPLSKAILKRHLEKVKQSENLSMFERSVLQENNEECRQNFIKFLKSKDEEITEEVYQEGIDINQNKNKKNEFFRGNNGLDIFQQIGSLDDPATDINMRKNFQQYENMDDEGRRLFVKQTLKFRLMGLKPLIIKRQGGNCRFHCLIENSKIFKITKEERKFTKKRESKQKSKVLFDIEKKNKICAIYEESQKTLDEINTRFDQNGVPHIISTRNPEIYLVMPLAKQNYPMPMLQKHRFLLIQSLKQKSRLQLSTGVRKIIKNMILFIRNDHVQLNKNNQNHGTQIQYLSYHESYGLTNGKGIAPSKGRPFGSYSQKTYQCLISNKEAVMKNRNQFFEYDDNAVLDLCPMVKHSKYRWIFNTQKIDRDLPQPEYEERTLAEKVAYDIQYPKGYDKRIYDFYSWRYHHKRRHQPINKQAKYGQYIDRDVSETISSVDSDELIETFHKIDSSNHELYCQDQQAFQEQIILFKIKEQRRVYEAYQEKQKKENKVIDLYYPSYKTPEILQERDLTEQPSEKSSSGCDVYEMQPHEYDKYLRDIEEQEIQARAIEMQKEEDEQQGVGEIKKIEKMYLKMNQILQNEQEISWEEQEEQEPLIQEYQSDEAQLDSDTDFDEEKISKYVDEFMAKQDPIDNDVTFSIHDSDSEESLDELQDCSRIGSKSKDDSVFESPQQEKRIMMDQMYKLILRGFRSFYRRLYTIYSQGDNTWKRHINNKGRLFNKFFRDLGLEKYVYNKESYKRLNSTIFKDYAEDQDDACSNPSEYDDIQYQISFQYNDSALVVSKDACQNMDDMMFDTDDIRQALLLLIFKKQFVENDKPVTKFDCHKLKLMYGDSLGNQQIIQRRDFTAILQNAEDLPQVYKPEDKTYQEFKDKKLTLEGKIVNKKHLKLFKVIFDQKNDRISRVQLFKNNLIQKLWIIFAESGVLRLYLNAIQKKYGSEQFKKFQLERQRILELTYFDLFQGYNVDEEK